MQLPLLLRELQFDDIVQLLRYFSLDDLLGTTDSDGANKQLKLRYNVGIRILERTENVLVEAAGVVEWL